MGDYRGNLDRFADCVRDSFLYDGKRSQPPKDTPSFGTITTMKNYRRLKSNSSVKGFTLIELLVVIAILAVLSVVVVLTLNPAGLLQEARDSGRISDLGILKNAVSLYLADVPNGNLASSSFGYGSCYVSTISGNGTTTANCGVFSTTYTANVSTTQALYRKPDSTGWLPVNFSQLSFGTPLAVLPVDPVNGKSQYYSYAATTTGSSYFEIDAFMESKKYMASGTNDVVTTDGGDNTSTFEVSNKPGSNL
jgi:prepilin-type N-terminal cleavage/methylation domain-containing protein